MFSMRSVTAGQVGKLLQPLDALPDVSDGKITERAHDYGEPYHYPQKGVVGGKQAAE